MPARKVSPQGSSSSRRTDPKYTDTDRQRIVEQLISTEEWAQAFVIAGSIEDVEIRDEALRLVASQLAQRNLATKLVPTLLSIEVGSLSTRQDRAGQRSC